MNLHGPALCGIPPTQRRLRHLRCIVLRNLVNDPSSPSLGAFYYTLHAPEESYDIDRITPPPNTPTAIIEPTKSEPGNNNNPVSRLNGLRSNSNAGLISPREYNVKRERGVSMTGQHRLRSSTASDEKPPELELNTDTKPDQTAPECTNSTDKPNDDELYTDNNKYKDKDAEPQVVPAQPNGTDLYRGNVDENLADDDVLPPPFYTSEVVTNTTNPTWRHLDCSRFHLLDFIDIVHSFNICVWSCLQGANDTAMTPVLQYEIQLADLEFIGAEFRQIGYYVFPPNTLIFEMRDGLYVTKETRDLMRPSRVADVKPPTAPDKRKPTTCNQFVFLSLIARKRQLQKTQESGRQLSTAIEQKLGDHASYFELVKQRDALRLRINQLKEESASAKATLKAEEDALKSATVEMLPRARSLTRAQIALLTSKQQLGNQEMKTLGQSKESLTALQASYEHRRWYLIGQIRTIYSIQQSSDGKSLSINGFRLPNSDFTGCDEEQIATALGYVAHILHLAAKYLEVPLRYPMIPMCSRSMILDEISQQTSPKFPLYSRGVDRTRFEYAVFLLNKNLEQLLNSQGLEIISLRHTVPNVQILLSKGQNLS